MQLLDQIVAWLVPAMCGGAVTLAAVAWRYGRAVIHGLCVLLRAEIIRIHREYVQSGRPIPVEVMDEADGNTYMMLELPAPKTGVLILAARTAGWTEQGYQGRSLTLVCPRTGGEFKVQSCTPPDTPDNIQLASWIEIPSDSTGVVQCRFYAPPKGGVWWSKPLLAEQADWQDMKKLNLAYFTGDTRPRRP